MFGWLMAVAEEGFMDFTCKTVVFAEKRAAMMALSLFSGMFACAYIIS
jgi:hypothetical protein